MKAEQQIESQLLNRSHMNSLLKYKNLRRRFISAINYGASTQCRLEEALKENEASCSELLRVQVKSKRLLQSNCELKYVNKRLQQELENKNFQIQKNKQIIQETLSDIRLRFGRLEASVITRNADTLQIVQHLKRIVESLTPSNISTDNDLKLDKACKAMSKSLEQLQCLYSGESLFQLLNPQDRGLENNKKEENSCSESKFVTLADTSDEEEEKDIFTRNRERFALEVENRMLREKVLDLKWQLKRANCYSKASTMSTEKTELKALQEAVHALRLRLEHVLEQQLRLRREIDFSTADKLSKTNSDVQTHSAHFYGTEEDIRGLSGEVSNFRDPVVLQSSTIQSSSSDDFSAETAPRMISVTGRNASTSSSLELEHDAVHTSQLKQNVETLENEIQFLQRSLERSAAFLS